MFQYSRQLVFRVLEFLSLIFVHAVLSYPFIDRPHIGTRRKCAQCYRDKTHIQKHRQVKANYVYFLVLGGTLKSEHKAEPRHSCQKKSVPVSVLYPFNTKRVGDTGGTVRSGRATKDTKRGAG